MGRIYGFYEVQILGMCDIPAGARGHEKKSVGIRDASLLLVGGRGEESWYSTRGADGGSHLSLDG